MKLQRLNDIQGFNDITTGIIIHYLEERKFGVSFSFLKHVLYIVNVNYIAIERKSNESFLRKKILY